MSTTQIAQINHHSQLLQTNHANKHNVNKSKHVTSTVNTSLSVTLDDSVENGIQYQLVNGDIGDFFMPTRLEDDQFADFSTLQASIGQLHNAFANANDISLNDYISTAISLRDQESPIGQDDLNNNIEQANLMLQQVAVSGTSVVSDSYSTISVIALLMELLLTIYPAMQKAEQQAREIQVAQSLTALQTSNLTAPLIISIAKEVQSKQRKQANLSLLSAGISAGMGGAQLLTTYKEFSNSDMKPSLFASEQETRALNNKANMDQKHQVFQRNLAKEAGIETANRQIMQQGINQRVEGLRNVFQQNDILVADDIKTSNSQRKDEILRIYNPDNPTDENTSVGVYAKTTTEQGQQLRHAQLHHEATWATDERVKNLQTKYTELGNDSRIFNTIQTDNCLLVGDCQLKVGEYNTKTLSAAQNNNTFFKNRKPAAGKLTNSQVDPRLVDFLDIPNPNLNQLDAATVGLEGNPLLSPPEMFVARSYHRGAYDSSTGHFKSTYSRTENNGHVYGLTRSVEINGQKKIQIWESDPVVNPTNQNQTIPFKMVDVIEFGADDNTPFDLFNRVDNSDVSLLNEQSQRINSCFTRFLTDDATLQQRVDAHAQAQAQAQAQGAQPGQPATITRRDDELRALLDDDNTTLLPVEQRLKNTGQDNVINQAYKLHDNIKLVDKEYTAFNNYHQKEIDAFGSSNGNTPAGEIRHGIDIKLKVDQRWAHLWGNASALLKIAAQVSNGIFESQTANVRAEESYISAQLQLFQSLLQQYLSSFSSNAQSVGGNVSTMMQELSQVLSQILNAAQQSTKVGQ